MDRAILSFSISSLCLAIMACGAADSEEPGQAPALDEESGEVFEERAEDSGEEVSQVAPALDVEDAGVGDEAEAQPCSSTRRPLVAAHGFIASGDTWAPHARRFIANGYCREDIYAFDWNSIASFGGDNESIVSELGLFIERVLEERGSAEVDLIAHSAGGGIAYTYLSDPQNAEKVANYAHVGSFPSEGPAGPNGEVPTLNVWSEGDTQIQDKADIPGATNLRQRDADHYGVATNLETFQAIFSHFNAGEEATSLEVALEERPRLWGRAITFGENTPIDGEMAIYLVDPESGTRLGEAQFEMQVPEGGHWGPFDVEAGLSYEFTIAQAGERPVHYYAEPFLSSNPLVYLRGFPGGGSLVGLLLASLPFDDVRTMLVVFSSTRALAHGQDSLQVDGVEILSEENASADTSSIAFFLYDADEDGETSMAPVELFQSFPFLVGADLALPASADGAFTVTLNGRSITVPAWPSESEGAVVVVFE